MNKVRIYGIEQCGVIHAREENSSKSHGWFTSYAKLWEYCRDNGFVLEEIYER